MAKNSLRQDITGLRAIAVLAVTLFHIDHVMLPDVDLFVGGFLGVDIFFVISGFLMTMLIMRQGGGLQSGDFSLLKFYQRRAKRICPALIVTIVFFLLLGYFVLSPEDLKDAGREASKAVLFISNFYFAHRTGYFAGQATDKLFLHTWSLSVEWQFYLVYPFVLMLAYRFMSFKAVGRLILACTLLSLGFACVYTTVDATSSYYMLPSRAFELLFGALAYFYPIKSFPALSSRFSPATFEALGILIIVVSLFTITDQKGWPNAWAVIPLFGTYLSIAANNERSWLRADVFQKLGLWSYAIYLVHWPLIVIYTKLDGEISWLWMGFLLIVPIFALSALMHYTIERRRGYSYKFLALYLILGSCTFLVAKTGIASRIPEPDIMVYSNYGGDFTRCDGKLEHVGDLERKPDFIMSGDSFVNQLTADLKDRGLHVVGVFLQGCQSFPRYYYTGDPADNERCSLRYSELKKAAAQYPDLPVVLGFNWSVSLSRGGMVERESGKVMDGHAYPEIIRNSIREIAQDFAEHEIYIQGEPELQAQIAGQNGRACFYLNALKNPLSNLMYGTIFCRRNTLAQIHPPTNEVITSTIAEIQEEMKAKGQKVTIHYLNAANALCENEVCKLYIDEKYQFPVLYNNNHFSWAGSVPINTMLLKTIGVEQGKVRTDFSTIPDFAKN